MAAATKSKTSKATTSKATNGKATKATAKGKAAPKKPTTKKPASKKAQAKKSAERAPRIHPGNLRKLQAELLGALLNRQGKATAPKTRTQLADETCGHSGRVSNDVGSENATIRAATEARIGYSTLVGMNYVSVHQVDDDGRTKNAYKITQSGIKALKEYRAAMKG